MNKFSSLFLGLMLMAGSSFTYAAGNGYCDGLRAQQDKVRCYGLAIDTFNNKVDANLRTIDALPKLSTPWKVNFHHQMQAWSNNVNRVCQRQVVCTYNSLYNEINVMNRIIAENR